MHERDQVLEVGIADVCQLRFSSSSQQPLAFAQGRFLSVGKFRADVEQLIDSFGNEPNVLISCAGRYAFAVALLATLVAGKTAVLPQNLTTHALQAVRKQCPFAKVCDEVWANNAIQHDSDQEHGSWCLDLDPCQTALHLYTSGSTGAPKVVRKSTANLFEEAQALLVSHPWPRSPIIGSVAPQHMYGLTFTVFLPWVAEVPWVDETPRFPQDLRDAFAVTDAGTLISVPAHYRALLEDDIDLSGIRCVSAAAALPEETAAAWSTRHGSAILEIYGSTETGVIAHRGLQRSQHWRPLPNVSLSETGGLLRVVSPYVGDGCPISGFETADRVVLHADQSFELLGRADSIIKVAGRRVSLDAVEKNLLSFPGVAEAAAIAVPTPGRVRDQVIWAVVAGSWQVVPDVEVIKAYLRKSLDGVEIPRRILVVDQMPHNAHGKLPRSALIELFRSTEQAGV